MFRTNAANSDDGDDDNRKIDQSVVMHGLGAPWSWMFDFVEHNSAADKSYNFIEIDEGGTMKVPYGTPVNADIHGSENVGADSTRPECLIERSTSQVDVYVPIMPGIGKPIQQGIAHDFLNYLRCRSIDENGMIFPRHFKETDCPKMIEN